MRAISKLDKNLCEKTPAFETSVIIEMNSTVGDLSKHILSSENLSFMGNEYGVNSLLGTAVGDDAIEIISDERMRIYGWCYEVNGKQPNMLTSDYILNPEIDYEIVWFYAYAELIRDKWISYCTPVYKSPTPFICK